MEGDSVRTTSWPGSEGYCYWFDFDSSFEVELLF